jgi:hypothetical protein
LQLKIIDLFQEGQENLAAVRRQTLIASQFPHRPLVIELPAEERRAAVEQLTNKE